MSAVPAHHQRRRQRGTALGVDGGHSKSRNLNPKHRGRDENRSEVVLIGSIVSFGPRVGIVVGEIKHHLRGDCWLVRTPTTVIKEQMGDLVPKADAQPATQKDLIKHCQQITTEARKTLMDWAVEVGAK